MKKLLFVLCCGLLMSCQVQREDIEYWKTSPAGYAKIKAVAESKDQPVNIRVLARKAMADREVKCCCTEKPLP